MTAFASDYSALYKAWQLFKKGKQPSRSIDAFAHDLEVNLLGLANDISHRTYRHGTYQAITLHEKKRRDLAVATVRDRLIHRLLYDYLVVEFDKGFDPDAWSCRKGKGLHKCLKRTQQLLVKYPNSTVWRADITKFFDSVGHPVLLDCLDRKLVRGGTAKWLCEEVINSYDLSFNKQGMGIPIGNLTSQIFANIYLNEFDRFARHSLKPQAYVRYGDDFILFYPTRRQAHIGRQLASVFLDDDLGLAINPKNDVIVAANKGLNFLGHHTNTSYSLVDAYTTRHVFDRITLRNASSYRALYLEENIRKQLDWTLLDQMLDI